MSEDYDEIEFDYDLIILLVPFCMIIGFPLLVCEFIFGKLIKEEVKK
jgi:hypothetical protein